MTHHCCVIFFISALVSNTLAVSFAQLPHIGDGQAARDSSSVSTSLPLFPKYFYASWFLLNTASPMVPPFRSQVPPANMSFGETYYDGARRWMVERYHDRCIDIFPGVEPTFSCQFINVNGTTWLVREYPSRTTCCVYRSPWWAPTRHFLHDASAVPNGTTSISSPFPINWYSIAVPPPAGPFAYGFYEGPYGLGAGVGRPGGFSFATTHGGFGVQMFYDVNTDVPPESAWTVPTICADAASCGV